MTQPVRKKLIEVALPLEAINEASAREKSIRHGHPSTLHLWWARRPLAAARAVIFAQMVDDPSAWPDLFPTEKAQEKERQRLFGIIEELVQWENTTNEEVIQKARDEIWRSWRRTCAENADHPQAKELFDRDKLPGFHDPFAGGGALPLEAQRLGLEAYASDLNPVAVLINKAMIEIPPKFAGQPPVNPRWRSEWREERNESALQASDRLAEGDGRSPGNLPHSSFASERGDLRHPVSDHASDGLDSGEHRRGLGSGIGQGESSIPGDRPGIARRSGDAPDIVRGSRVVPGGGDGNSSELTERNKQDVNRDATEQAAVNLSSQSSALFSRQWKGAQGLAEDVRFYGQWMRDEAEKRIGHLYPKIRVTKEMAAERPDLKPYEDKELTVIAWIWARTVKSPNPAFRDVDVPLASTFMLSTKPGKEAYVEPVIENGGYRFVVKVGKPSDPERAKRGTKLARGANFECVMSGAVIGDPYIKQESMGGRMRTRMMAIVAEGTAGRIYLPPVWEHAEIAESATPTWVPDEPMNRDTSNLVSGRGYGFFTWADLFTPRQLTALTTFSDLVAEARERVKADFLEARGEKRGERSEADGLPSHSSELTAQAQAYADAVATYLGFALSKQADLGNSLCRWEPIAQCPRQLFARQAIPMVWDFAEGNPIGRSSGSWHVFGEGVARALENSFATWGELKFGQTALQDAAIQGSNAGRVVSTDPPYYDNIGYADLSDFFYVWLRRSLKDVYPDLFATIAVPKAEELVATPFRHGGKDAAEKFFLDGMTEAMRRICNQAHPAFPVTIYYAFKQSETTDTGGQASTGWETFLEAVIGSGFGLTGTWPIRTENRSRMIGQGTNALASSIVLVCRRRDADAPTATRREFLTALQRELPKAIADLQRGNIAPVDLQQAAIGPGMAVFTRYAKVLDADGKPLAVRDALAMINQALDEVLAEQEGDFDADTRWALAWFEQFGFSEGDFGVAETLSKAKNTSVGGIVEAGIAVSGRGKVRLLRPEELPESWTPEGDKRLTVWDMVHHLIRVLDQGEGQAADLMAKLGTKAEVARELAYRLYAICDRTKRSQDAQRYNGLVQSWPEIAQMAQQLPKQAAERQQSFEGME